MNSKALRNLLMFSLFAEIANGADGSYISQNMDDFVEIPLPEYINIPTPTFIEEDIIND